MPSSNVRPFDVADSLMELQEVMSLASPSSPRAVLAHTSTKRSPEPRPTAAETKAKRVRVQAFQQVPNANSQHMSTLPPPVQQPSSSTPASSASPVAHSRLPMSSSSLHNSAAGTNEAKAPPAARRVQIAPQKPINSSEACKPSTTAPTSEETTAAAKTTAADEATAATTATAAPPTGQQAQPKTWQQRQQQEAAPVSQWVYKFAPSNSKTVELLMTREVLCFTAETLSYDLPTCNELRAITQFRWEDINAVLAE